MIDDAEPHPASPGTPPTPLTAAAGLQRADAGLLDAIGHDLTPSLEQAHGIVQDFVRSGRIGRSQVQLLAAALDEARTVALQIQQLGQLSAHPQARPLPTALRADILVSQSLARQMPKLQRQRVQLAPQHATPAWVHMDRELLPRLIDAAIGWCCRPDHRLTVTLEPSGDLHVVLLRLRLQPGRADTSQPEPTAQLSWHLLEALARQQGVRLQQQQHGADTVLTLGLSKSTNAAPDPLPGDLLTSHDSLLTSDGAPLLHQRVLLVTRHEEVRAEVEHVCASLGAAVDWVATGAAAERQFAQVLPDLVLIDARNADAALVRLQQRAMAATQELPWIEIAQDASSASLTQWIREDGLTLHNLRTQLAATLLHGLSRVRPR